MRFLATGGDSATVRRELRAVEAGLDGLRAELADLDRTAAVVAPRVHRTWILTQLEHFEDLLATDRARAKIAIVKHLDGELTIFPQPSLAGERRAEV